jgi:peptide/nickel transport system permease protein
VKQLLLARLLQSFVTLILLSVLIFVLSRVIGNPADTLIPLDAPPEARERLTRSLGLDRPLVEQYVTYVSGLVRGDLGVSVRSREPVADLIAARLPASLALAAVAMLFAIALALPLGIVAALNRGKPLDTLAAGLALFGQSVPAFWVGILLIQLFAVNLRWLPPSGAATPLHYVMPAFTMSLFVLAGMTRLLRTAMLGVLDSEYVRFARSKGVGEREVIWQHALRNALIPVVSFGGVYFSILITMAIVTEVVFAWPGIGRLAYNAVILRDFPLMQAVVLATGVIVILVSFAVDVIYALVDPRIRYSQT